MTITLTPEEITKFSSDLEKWNMDCLNFILTHYNPRDFDTMFRDRPTDHLITLRKKFESENPKPDWRSLL